MRSAHRRPPSRARARLRPRRSAAPRPHRRRRPLLRRPRPRRPRSARRLRRRPRRIPDGRLSAVISVVVPVYNEERSVALLYDELRSALEPLQTPWETIFVDDGSTDGTFAALTRLHNAEENVRVVRLRRNFGKAAALVAGFDQARGETVVTIDGDLQDDPAENPRLLAPRPLADRQPRDEPLLGCAHARPQLRAQGLSRGRGPRATPLWGAPPVHSGARPLPRLPHRRAPRQSPAARARTLALRRGALRARLPRPPDRVVHRTLPSPAAAPVRRARAHPRIRRQRHPRLPHRAQRDRASAAADAGRSPPGDRNAVLFARPDQRDDHEPSLGTCAGARARGAARRRNPVLRRRLGGAA